MNEIECGLDDQDMIDSIFEIDPSIMEPLFWSLEDALYKGNQPLAKSIYKDFLYSAKYRNELIANLRPVYRQRLQEIAYELHGESTVKERKSIEIKTNVASRPLPFSKEFELQNFLSTNPGILKSALGEDVKIIGIEVKTDFDYRCDIVAESEDTCYPIELKIGQANHAVVSQCNKYCFYFYRTHRYGCYKKIQGVVCASGFDDWSINELRREGIWIFDIVPDGEGIKLVRIP